MDRTIADGICTIEDWAIFSVVKKRIMKTFYKNQKELS
jgi:hypothetical protein